jgi:translation elongation factor EF-1beta
METPPSASRFSTSLQQQPHGKNKSKRPWAWMNSRNNESTALKHTTSNNNNINKWQPSSFLSMHTNKRNRLIAATVVLSTSAAVLAAVPFSANAIDLASITGGATELATSTTNWVQSLSETGFYQAFTLVFLSEIGDKTFFMAGLLAIQTSKFTSFIGSMAALAVMTIISVLIGQIFHAVPAGISQGVPLDDVAAVLAFAFFGFKTLQDAIAMDDDQSVMEEELEEAEETVEDSSINKVSTKW